MPDLGKCIKKIVYKNTYSGWKKGVSEKEGEGPLWVFVGCVTNPRAEWFSECSVFLEANIQDSLSCLDNTQRFDANNLIL